MIDEDGYRLNVGIILLNKQQQVFWGKRKGESAWQFPQGGLNIDEQIEEAMLRELNEELGLFPKHIEILARTNDWLYYNVPHSFNRFNSKGYRGQKQIWYLLNFLGKDYHINIKSHKEPEFDAWRWINYWEPINLVINFKQNVYKQALNELAQLSQIKPQFKEISNKI